MAVELFKHKENSCTDSMLAGALADFNLNGRTVLCHSRLFSLGRITRQSSVDRIIEVLLDAVGTEGTLCVPAYTMSAYNDETFDIRNSRCPTGILGETARKNPKFRRSLHPVYSTCCTGVNSELLVDKQSPHTCFGPDSFFDLFSGIENSCFLMLGINLSVLTACHYYDQLNNAPGRFIKKFTTRVIDGNGRETELEFDSYVKDRDFYQGRHTCLARFDALATELGFIRRTQFGADWLHFIDEKKFALLYRACLAVDQEYFLTGTMEEFTRYYRKGDFSMYHHSLADEKVAEVKKLLDNGE